MHMQIRRTWGKEKGTFYFFLHGEFGQGVKK